ncbi:MAG: hypothetical protein ACXAC0_09630 [Candidatus Thorarchaeota archaeon]
MRRRQFGGQKSSIIALIALSLIVLNTFVCNVSGSISVGKQSDFEYYHMSGDWGYYVRFTVMEWDVDLGIAIVRETNKTGFQDYRLRIPEWYVVDAEGYDVERWQYCPIWFNISSLEEGFVFEDSRYWFYNFTVDRLSSSICELERFIYGEEYDIIEHLYYDVDSERIDQYDYSNISLTDYTVATVTLRYLEDGWTFSTTEEQGSIGLTAILAIAIVVEIEVIIILLYRRKTGTN